MQQKTYYPKAAEIQRKWFMVDADGQNLGRLATRIAHVLLGKHKPTFTPGVAMGDYVVVVNAERVAVTGTRTRSRLDTKIYYHHSGYPGGALLAAADALVILNRHNDCVPFYFKASGFCNPCG